jgi:hypothetical protein
MSHIDSPGRMTRTGKVCETRSLIASTSQVGQVNKVVVASAGHKLGAVWSLSGKGEPRLGSVDFGTISSPCPLRSLFDVRFKKTAKDLIVIVDWRQHNTWPERAGGGPGYGRLKSAPQPTR